VVLWELISGRAPWENYNPMQVGLQQQQQYIVVFPVMLNILLPKP
jgi:hypothetical protein